MPMLMVALFTIAKKWKQPKGPSTNECISELWSIHTVKYSLALIRNEVLMRGTAWKSVTEDSMSYDSIHGKFSELGKSTG